MVEGLGGARLVSAGVPVKFRLGVEDGSSEVTFTPMGAVAVEVGVSRAGGAVPVPQVERATLVRLA